MKTRKFSIAILSLLLFLFISSCEKDEPVEKSNVILPDNFKIDIPNSISNNYPIEEDSQLKSLNSTVADVDSVDGDHIYRHLNHFIAIGEAAADIVQDIMQAIRVYNINQEMQLTIIGDDGRNKRLIVEENVDFQGKTWQFQLTIIDILSETNDDGGIGLQVFWNTNPVEGIAIIRPFHLDRKNNLLLALAMYSIEYSERGRDGYEKYMIVGISDLPTRPLFRYDMSTLKMFVGKKGEVIDVFGNSNHPRANFRPERGGFNWAFVASGSQLEDKGVAEVGLPPSLLNSTDREIILGKYSVKNVMTKHINEVIYHQWGVYPDSAQLAALLGNADAPGYFNSDGFVQGGTAPDTSYMRLQNRIQYMTPFNPLNVTTLDINFKR